MDIIVKKRELQRLVMRALAVAARKSTLPILANILLDASTSGKMTVRATDLYLSVSGKMDAETVHGGIIAVPAREFAERIKTMPDSIRLTSENGTSVVVRGVGVQRRYTIQGATASEFPVLPEPHRTASRVELPAELMIKLINRTQFSIGTDESRPILNSALFEWEEDTLRVVTSDGHRLSKSEAHLPMGARKTEMLMSLKAMLELCKLSEEAKTEGSPVILIHEASHVFFEVGGITFGAKLVSGQFPPYKQVIPDTTRTEHTVRVQRAVLVEALKAVSLASTDHAGGVKIGLSPGKMRLECESPEGGFGFDELAVGYDGHEMSIGFNGKYLLEVLASLDPENEIEIRVARDLDPAVISPTSDEAGLTSLSVIMPMKILAVQACFVCGCGPVPVHTTTQPIVICSHRGFVFTPMGPWCAPPATITQIGIVVCWWGK